MRKSFLVFPYSECIGRLNVVPPPGTLLRPYGCNQGRKLLNLLSEQTPCTNPSPQVYKTLNASAKQNAQH
jgi:hypothetical protein